MNDGNDLNTTLSNGLVEHFLFSGSVKVQGNQSNSFNITNTLYKYDGPYSIDTSNSSYFTIKLSGFYKINAVTRFSDNAAENDMCLYIVTMNSNGSEYIRLENWQHKKLRLTIFNEMVVYLEEGQKVAIATYNLSNSDLSTNVDVNVYIYLPYNWNL